jgi:hypothetical protein
VLSVAEYLQGDSMLGRDDSNSSVGIRDLIPQNGSLIEVDDLWLFIMNR